MPADVAGVFRVFCRRGTQAAVPTADMATQSALTFLRSAGCQTEGEFPGTEWAVEGAPAYRRGGHPTCCLHSRDVSEHANGHKAMRIEEEPHACLPCLECNHRATVCIVHEKVDRGRTLHVHCASQELFSQKCNVLSRTRTYTDERPFGCSVCQRSFSKRRYLNAHEKLHIAEKPYACRFCPKCFIRKDSLDYHERSHTGERPFACSVCHRKFACKSNVVSHEQTHTGEKPFSCSICWKRFTRKAYMVLHERLHT